MLTRELGGEAIGTNEGDVDDVVMFERRGQCQGIGIFIDDTEDLVGAIPAIVEFVKVGGGGDSF